MDYSQEVQEAMGRIYGRIKHKLTTFDKDNRAVDAVQSWLQHVEDQENRALKYQDIKLALDTATLMLVFAKEYPDEVEDAFEKILKSNVALMQLMVKPEEMFDQLVALGPDGEKVLAAFKQAIQQGEKQ